MIISVHAWDSFPSIHGIRFLQSPPAAALVAVILVSEKTRRGIVSGKTHRCLDNGKKSALQAAIWLLL